MPDKAFCNRPACTRKWPRDPALEVVCPVCFAPIGVACKRPSGHRIWGGQPHDRRDLLADSEGKYGPCPLGVCGADRKPDAGALCSDCPPEGHRSTARCTPCPRRTPDLFTGR